VERKKARDWFVKIQGERKQAGAGSGSGKRRTE